MSASKKDEKSNEPSEDLVELKILPNDSAAKADKSSKKSTINFKTLSISSTDSLFSDNCSNSMNEPPKKLNDSKCIIIDDNDSEDCEQPPANNEYYREIDCAEIDENEFIRSGAIPKRKSSNLLLMQNSTKSSLSSSTSSSLSSLISQNSSAPSNKSKTNKTKSAKKIQNQNRFMNFTDFEQEKTSYEPDNFDSCDTETTKCPLCFKTVRNNLELHFRMEHREFECPFCGLLFDTDNILDKHINDVHNDPVNINSMSGNLIDDRTESKQFTCPVCDIKISDELGLEIHVDSHFNQTNSQINSNTASLMVNRSFSDSDNFSEKNENKGPSAGAAYLPKPDRSRTQSTSSLTANVDENFEIDQLITLSEDNNFEMFDGNYEEFDSASFSKKPTSHSVTNSNYEEERMNTDYEIALLLDKEEKDKFRKVKSETFATENRVNMFGNGANDDFQTAQMIERQQNQALKYQLSKMNRSLDFENDYFLSANNEAMNQADLEYATELEHEWLKQRFGMSDVKASAKAISNLDRALQVSRIDYITYQHEKSSIEEKLNSIYDDGTTCNRDLIELIQTVPLNKFTNKRLLSTKCYHYHSSYIDSGYGCGYRNTQMLLSSLREDPELKNVIFNNNNRSMPSITKLQQLIETAWKNGFDEQGKSHFGGVLKHTAKWIGATDVACMLSFLRIKVELVDIKCPNNNVPISSILFKFVKNYFESESKTGHHIHPIYIQHDGHSRTIVGIEVGSKNDNLLIFDPGTRQTQIDKFKENKFKFMNIFRRSPASFNSKKEYQLLVIRGAITADGEYESSKILKSTMLTS